MSNLIDKMIDNNLKGKELEKAGRVDEAVKLYTFNIKNRFNGSFPYDRLATIYRKQKQYDKEIEVLELAINVFTNSVDTLRSDRLTKLEKYKTQLQKAKTRVSQ